MPPKASKPSITRGRSKSPVANRPSTKKAKKDTMEEETPSPKQLLNQQQVPQQDSSTSKILPLPELMDTEPISSVDNFSKDKGKNPEIILDEDQAFDASENMLNTLKDNKNILTFERDNDTSTLYAYCAAEKFFPSKSNKEKINEACAFFNRPQFLAFIGASIKISPDDNTKKIIRVGFTYRVEYEKAITVQIPILDNATFSLLTN
ncbi:3791_t:CDS:1 [Funneliformis geosporum]|nr:3791_t:CDS:1 [Funneliformis geosporum]